MGVPALGALIAGRRHRRRRCAARSGLMAPSFSRRSSRRRILQTPFSHLPDKPVQRRGTVHRAPRMCCSLGGVLRAYLAATAVGHRLNRAMCVRGGAHATLAARNEANCGDQLARVTFSLAGFNLLPHIPVHGNAHPAYVPYIPAISNSSPQQQQQQAAVAAAQHASAGAATHNGSHVCRRGLRVPVRGHRLHGHADAGPGHGRQGA